MYAKANLDLKMADICIRLQGRYFIKSIYTFIAGIKIIISLPCLHIFCFLLCRNETDKKLNKIMYLSTVAILDIKMANLFTLNGYSVWGNKSSFNNSENYKDKYLECLMCAGHFQCLHFRHFVVLKLQHANYRYRKPQTQYLPKAYSTKSYQFELLFQTY